MNNSFLNLKNINYQIRKSRRARRMRIAVNCDMSVTVTMPYGINVGLVENFVTQKLSWIIKSLNYFKKFEGRVLVKPSKRDYLENRHKALELAKTKVVQWNKFYNFSFKLIGVKNQKTRWGSCSKKGNLNFNYKIVHLPESLVDYLAVHELCHLKEFNHSRSFWDLVSQAIPNYKVLRSELKNYQYLK